MQRFPWSELYRDESWQFNFLRSVNGQGFWPYGFTSLLEATALYRDLLYKYGDFFEVNKYITQQIRSIRLNIGNETLKNTPLLTYFGPFFLLEEYFQNKDVPPLHFVPIAAFWALNSSLPHLTLNKEIIGRKNESDLPWTEVDPNNLFYTFLLEITDDLNRESQGNSLIDLAKMWEPRFYSNSDKIIPSVHVEDIINEDVAYLEKIKDQSESLGKCFSIVFKDIKILKTKEERMKYFFSSPLNNYPTQGIEIIKDGNSPSPDKLDAYLLNALANHLIPISSFRSLNRFRLGKTFLCPSISEPFNTLCPAKGICNGQFPGTEGMPSKCWFKNSIKQNLYLDPNRIGIVDGEFESEEEVLRILYDNK